MNQGRDPSNLPSNSLLPSAEQQESVVSSEISLHTSEEPFIMEKDVLKVKKIENIDSQNFKTPSLDEVKDFSDSPSAYQPLLDSAEETVDSENADQSKGGLFKSPLQLQEFQNFVLPTTHEEVTSPEHSKMSEVTSVLSKDSSHAVEDYECKSKTSDISQKISQEFSKSSETTSFISEHITAVLDTFDEDQKFEGRAPSDSELCVPKLSTIIQSQIQDSSKVPEDISLISDDNSAAFTHNQELVESQISELSKNQELSKASEDEYKQAFIESSDIQIAKHSKISEEDSLIPEDALSVLTFEQSSTSNLASALHAGMEDFEGNKLISDSEKLESGDILQKDSGCDDENYGLQYRDTKLEEDDYSILQMDEDFEDGLRLVEETEKLINEFCDIYPSECFDVSSNEIQNLNTKNNKHDSTYDSEYEWKLNEERYNSLNANFIENKAYKMDITSAPSPDESKAPLIINTGTPADNLELNKSIADSRKSTSSLADISEISEFIDESNFTQIIEKNDITGEDDVPFSVQPLSVLCQAATSSTQGILSEIMPSVSLLLSGKETLEAGNEESDDSLVTSTHSSVSTQIAVFADTVLQDVTEELGISLDNKTTEDIDEKSSSSTNIPLNLKKTESMSTIDKKEDNEIIMLNENVEINAVTEKETNNLPDFDSNESRIRHLEHNKSEIVKELDFKSKVQQPEDQNINESSDLDTVSRSIECMEASESESIKKLDREIKIEKSEEFDTGIEQDISNKLIADELNEDVMTGEIDNLCVSNLNTYGISVPEYEETLQDRTNDDVPDEISLTLMSHFYDEWIGKTEEQLEIQQSEDLHDENKIELTEELNLEIEVEETEELMKEIETGWSEVENTVETGETSDFEITANYPEESSLSLMSHFYDEWIENVKTSETQQIDIRNLYVSNDLSESASSENVSESEDFATISKTELPSELIDSISNDAFVDSVIVVSETEPIKLSEQGVIYISEEKDQSQVQESFLSETYARDQNLFKSCDEHSSVSVVTKNEPVESSDHRAFHNIDEKYQSPISETIFSEISVHNENLSEGYDDVLYSTVQVKIEKDVLNNISDNVDVSASAVQDISKQEKVEIIDRLVEKMYSVSKSCQTDDSFEEDQFFDSFDDPSFDPGFIFPPVLKSSPIEPVKTEIGVQCCLIPSEITLISDVAVISLDSNESHEAIKKEKTGKVVPTKGTIGADEEPALQILDVKKDGIIVFDSSTKQKKDSSSEASDDTDSDIFLEPYSSHDEVETDSKSKGYLYAEIDSDTGFSSGSDSGRRSSRHKSYSKETVNFRSQKIESKGLDDESAISDEASIQKTVEQRAFHVTLKSESTEKIQTNVDEKKGMTLTEHTEFTTEECAVSDISRKIDLPEDILERAVTPVSIKRLPSIESDLKFVDIEDEPESSELKEKVVETKIFEDRVRTPTVEYFYGLLPQSVQKEIQQENNECFVEALDLLDTCSAEIEKDISDNSFSTQLSDSKFSLPGDSGDVEDLSESLASFHEPEDDLLTESISEYFGLPESEGTSESKFNGKFIKTEIVSQDSSTQVKSSGLICEEGKSSLKIHQEMELKKMSTLEQQKLIGDVSKSSPTINSFENLDQMEIQKKTDTSEKDMKEVIPEIETEQISISDVFSEKSAQSIPSADIPQLKSIESDMGTNKTSSALGLKKSVCLKPEEQVSLSPEAEVGNFLHEDEQKKSPADISISRVDAQQESKEMFNVTKLGDSLYVDSMTDYFSVEKISSKEVSESSPDIENFFQKSIPEYFASGIDSANIEQAKSLIYLSDTKVSSSAETNSEIINLDSDPPVSEVFDQSDYQETEISVYEESSEDFKNLNDLETFKPSEIPPAPSDIVRYLYYDDSIKFEDDPSTCEDSLNSMHFTEQASSMPKSDTASKEIYSLDKGEQQDEFKSRDVNHSFASPPTQEPGKTSSDICTKSPTNSVEVSPKETNELKADQDSPEKLATDIHHAKEKRQQESETLYKGHPIESLSTLKLENIPSDISIKDSTCGLGEDGNLEKPVSDFCYKKMSEMQQESESLVKSHLLESSSQLEPEKVSTEVSLEQFRSDQDELPKKLRSSNSHEDGFGITYDEDQHDTLDKGHCHDSSSTVELGKVSSDISVDKSKDTKETLKKLDLHQDQIKLKHEKLDKSHGCTDNVIYPNEESLKISLQSSQTEAIDHPVLHKKDTIEEIIIPQQETEASLSSSSNSQYENPVAEVQKASGPSEIQSKPSDIVRYLYYDDSIEFEGDESFYDESLNSIHSFEPSSLPELETASSSIIASNLNIDEKEFLKESLKLDVDEHQSKEHPLPPPKKDESLESGLSPSSLENITDEQFIHVCDSENDQFESVYTVSESTDQWFDLETSKSFQASLEKSQISERSVHLTETKTTTQDGDLPCIPGLLLEDEIKDNVPIAAADGDDVTDISTHFTMTEDESDKFSDIESDSSVNNFDEEVLFAVDQNKNEVTDFEIDRITDIEDDKENILQPDDLLDQNANKNEENYPEECATPTDFEKQDQDIEAALRDVNGNLAVFITNSGISNMAENVGSETQEADSIVKDEDISIQATESEIYTASDAAVMRCTPTESFRDEFFDISQADDSSNISKIEPDNMPKDQSISVLTTESEICTTSDAAVMKSTPTESCKDEFFEISQVDDSLDLSISGHLDNWIDAESGGLTETEEIQFNLPEERISETAFVFEMTDSLVKNGCNISNKESNYQIIKTDDITVPAQEASLFIKTESSSKEHLSETKESMLTDEAISLDESAHNEVVKEIYSSNLDVVKMHYVTEKSPESAYASDVLQSTTELAKEEDNNFCSTIEQKDVSQETCGGFYETKERGSDDFPKSLEALPNPVSDVSGTECIPNFGTEGKILLPLDEDASLEDKRDICAQLKTDSDPDDGKLKADEIKTSNAQENYVVDFKGIIDEQCSTILSCQLKDNIKEEAVSISQSLEPNILKSDIKEADFLPFQTVELPTPIDSFVNKSDEKLDIRANEIIFSQSTVHDETIVDFKAIVDDSILFNKKQKDSSEKETISDYHSIGHIESSILKYETINEEVVEKRKEFSSDTVHDKVIVDFKGVISDSELLNKQQHYNLERGTVAVDFESASPFEDRANNNFPVKSTSDKDSILITEDTEQNKCTVDFKGIVGDLELFSNEQKVVSKDKTFNAPPVAVDILKPEFEISSSEIPPLSTVKKESDKKFIEKTQTISSLVVADDNRIVDFKGIILQPELIRDQEDSGIESTYFNRSTSIEQTELNILKSEAKEIEGVYSEVSHLDAPLNIFSSTETEYQIKFDKENNASILESGEPEKYIVDFKNIISDSDLLNDSSNRIDFIEQQNLSQLKEISSTTMGSLVSTIESSSQEKMKEVVISESDEKTTCIVDFKSIVSDSGVFSEKLLVSEHVQKDEQNTERETIREGKLPKEKVLSADIREETCTVDFRGIPCDAKLSSNKQENDKEFEKVSSSKSTEQLKKNIVGSKEDIEKVTVHKQFNEFSVFSDADGASSDNKNLHEKSVKEIPRESLNEMSISSETDSSYFHSAHEDVDNTSVFTSDDDFTDVHSHITFTEDSDKWSDVETDTSFAFEDFNQDSFDMREKTPTRDDYESSFELPTLNGTPEPKTREIFSNVDISSKKMDLKKDKEESSSAEEPEKQIVLHLNELENAPVLDSLVTTLSSSISDVKHQETSSEKPMSLDNTSKSDELNASKLEEPQKAQLISSVSEHGRISEIFTETSDSTFKISDSEFVTDSLMKSNAVLPDYQPESVLSDDNTDVMSFNSVTDECETWSDNEMTASLTDQLKLSIEEERLEINVEHTTVVTVEAKIIPDVSKNIAERPNSEVLNNKSLEPSLSPAMSLAEETKTALCLSQEVKSPSEPVLEESKPPSVSLSKDGKSSSQFLSKEDIVVSEEEIIKTFDSSRENSKTISSTDQNDLSYCTISKDEDSEKFSELDAEISETSASSFFETLSKDDDSVENFSDFGMKGYEVSESEVIFTKKCDESTLLLLDTSKNNYQKSPSTEAEEKKLSDSSCSNIPHASVTKEVYSTENIAAAEQVKVNEFEPDIAVPKIHKETADISLGVEKTEESDNWLEADAETEFSISEFEDEAVSFSDKGKPEPLSSETVGGSGVSEDKVNAFETPTQLSSEDMTGISTSFYSESEYSDQVSDTYADISLQGGTTENSDRWSDIEAEDVINEVAENIPIIDAKELIAGFDLSINGKQESTFQSEDIDFVDKESKLAENLECNSGISKELVSTSEIVEVKQDLLDCSLIKVEGKDDNKINKHLSSTPEKLLDTTSGVSDDDFTSVTPIDPTVGESDKWSDISDDTSVEEMLDSSKSLSLQKDILSQPDSKPKAASNVDTVKKIDVDDIELTADFLPKSKQLEPESNFDLPVEAEVFEESYEKSNIDVESPNFSEDQALDDIPDNHMFLHEKEITGAVPSDISDTSRNQLESSIEADIHTQDGLYNSRNVPSPIYEDDEEPLEGEEYFDDYDPNFDEHEMELAEEQYLSGSVPFILNDDELVYPLQYGDDWIEESFDLKEYGVETVFTGSEADVHGLNINEEFDEDIRRAVDFNINNFEEASESFMDDQNLTTESFKTLSDNTPTQSKLTDKEHDSWSTADADSIADDHDDVLAKIDEILAEDFGYGKLGYFDDKQGSRNVNRIIEEEDDNYSQDSPMDSPCKDETENLQFDNFICQSSTAEAPQKSVVPIKSEDSMLTEKFDEDSSSLFKDICSSSNKITYSATEEMTETVKMKQPTEVKETLKGNFSGFASEKKVKLEGHSEEADIFIKETTELQLTPEKVEILSSEEKSEFLSGATSVLPKATFQSKSPENADALLDVKVKLSSEVMKLKSSSEKTVSSEEIVSQKVASNKIDTPSEVIALQSSTEKVTLSLEKTAKLQSLDKTGLLADKDVKLKESSGEIGVSSGKITEKSENTLKSALDKTIITSEEIRKSPEKTTLLLEETVKLQSHVKTDLSSKEASLEETDLSPGKVEKISEMPVSLEKVVGKSLVKKAESPEKILKKSSEKRPLLSEKVEERSSKKKSESPEKIMEISSEKKPLSSEKGVERSPEKKSELTEKIMEKSKKKPLSPEKVVEKSSEKKSTSQDEVAKKSPGKSISPEKVVGKSLEKKLVPPEKVVEKSSEKKSVILEKEAEKSVEKTLPSEEAKKLETSSTPASEETVQPKSSLEQVPVSIKDTVNLKSHEKSSISSKEELTLKSTVEKTDRLSEEEVKLKSSPEKISVSEEGKMELKKTDISSEKIAQSVKEEVPTLPPKKASLLSEKTMKPKSSAEDDDLRIEKDVKLKESSKEMDISSEITVKKFMEKKSMSSQETVELKSSPDKISTSLEEAKKIEISSDIVSSSSDEVKLLKASLEKTDASLEELEKSKLSLQKAAISSEEIVKLKVTTEKTDVSSKDIVTQNSSTETAVLSLDKTVKLKTSSQKSCASSEEVLDKLPSEKLTVPSKKADSKLSLEESSCNETVKLQSALEKTVSSKVTVESKTSLKKSDTSEDYMKLTSSFEETSDMPVEVKPDIPLKNKYATDMRGQSEESHMMSEADSDSSQSISDIPSESDSKPNIPDKTRRRSRPKPEIVSEDEGSRRRRPKPKDSTDDEAPRRRRPKPETTSEDGELQKCRSKPETLSDDEGSSPKAPTLPRKRPKRDSSTESLSSSVFLSSSSEPLSSFETASLKESSKSDALSSKISSSVSEDAPEIPARKAKVKSSPIRQRKRENSEDSSSASAASKSSVKSCDLPPKEAMDLCRKRTSIDERMIKLQNEGKCNTKEKAFIAAKLIEMQFEEEDALLASRQCSSVYHAIKFLTQLCEMCNCRFPINLMSSMVYCTHRACKECFKAHFTSLIYDRSVFTFLCPICNKPDITDQNIQEYFNHLDMLFRNILDSHVYDLFQRKLRDEVLTKDPNFHWCSQCSSGFIASPRLKKLYCPDCSAITCALCHQTWELEHEGVHCERFQQWKDMHTPEPPPAGLVKYLADRGVACPSCELVYPQACGGCLMYRCSHCSFEFCGFCSSPYKRGKDCGDKSCESRGVHAHHPYSCLFFLRDIEMSDLQMLLEEESVTYLTIPPKDQIVKSRCQVREQKHIHRSLSEDRCGRDIVPYCAGLCRTHYYEYLAELFRKKKINPLPIMTTHDLQFILRKSRLLVPDRVKGETNDDYYKRLTKVVSSTLT